MEEESIKKHIVARYLTGTTSYRKLQAEYGFNIATLHSWVQQHRYGMSKPGIKKVLKAQPGEAREEAMPTDIKVLQAELRKARLHNKVLSAVIDIAEEELGVDIRKKYGTRQS
jgi:transposase-like protein